ncbi:hypothetical protein K505DRAFT_385031 [Melanomma pulvis-pyrius CBS 109.77]|uniref:Uncharacterized protein n=1 Tax=Melanomma pulvis-pyrius CBS 109.77 TaxID=1314802 RepID=A0A6A6XDH8_9PLEO|nr:hypothetical protein K505DRAFT_385031 [Melanomma pulvis-pyrius CBS 109.77]
MVHATRTATDVIPTFENFQVKEVSGGQEKKDVRIKIKVKGKEQTYKEELEAEKAKNMQLNEENNNLVMQLRAVTADLDLLIRNLRLYQHTHLVGGPQQMW